MCMRPAPRGMRATMAGLRVRGKAGTVRRRGVTAARFGPAARFYRRREYSMPLPSIEEWRAAGRLLRFRGHDAFMRVGGRGPALLLIHGFPTAGWDWCKLWPELAQHFTLVTPDLLGFGFSAQPAGPASPIAEAADP